MSQLICVGGSILFISCIFCFNNTDSTWGNISLIPRSVREKKQKILNLKKMLWIGLLEKKHQKCLLEALEMAKEIAIEMDIGTSFCTRREIKRKRQFDEYPDDTNIATQSTEESFRIN